MWLVNKLCDPFKVDMISSSEKKYTWFYHVHVGRSFVWHGAKQLITDSMQIYAWKRKSGKLTFFFFFYLLPQFSWHPNKSQVANPFVPSTVTQRGPTNCHQHSLQHPINHTFILSLPSLITCTAKDLALHQLYRPHDSTFIQLSKPNMPTKVARPLARLDHIYPKIFISLLLNQLLQKSSKTNLFCFLVIFTAA